MLSDCPGAAGNCPVQCISQPIHVGHSDDCCVKGDNMAVLGCTKLSNLPVVLAGPSWS